MRTKTTAFRIARCGVLSAISILLFYLEIPIVPPYKLDFSTLPAILAGFAMGPVYGMAVVLLKNLVHMLSSSSGMVGELADFLMSAAYVITASAIYRCQKTKRSALFSMLAGTLVMTVSAVFVNKYILFPLYGMNEASLAALGQSVWHYIDSSTKFLLLVTAPFNLLKGAVLSLVTFVLYKRLSPLLHDNI